MKESIFSLVVVLLVSGVSVGQDSVFVQMAGDTVTIWDKNARENCASRFEFFIAWSNSNDATITETDTVGPIANCICTYDLSTTFLGLGVGHYSVEIDRQYLKRYRYDHDTTVRIGSVEFDIVGSGTAQYSAMSHQSKCPNESAVEVQRQVPQRFALAGNYPNPFNPTTVISYQLPVASYVTLKVYNMLGQEVATLVEGTQEAGYKSVEWNAGARASGIYFCRLEATSINDRTNHFMQVKEIVLIR
jgi:hypothetical protein